MHSGEIRATYLRFFEEKGHTVVPGSSLIPRGDPTLLLTSAGMVQFKPYYLGEAVPPNRRLASCQKCFRTTDIEVVGDSNHLTFFEMLGNFSIGDYFKRETISWAWEFVTQRLGLSPERLWATVFLDDNESFQYWREQGIPEERIIRFGEEDNFWGPAGDSGPCGPCSELHYDFGEKFGCGKPSCGPNCDCGRFSEIWNLVFTQYNQDKEGKRTPLPKPNIDTGLGLERVAAIMQGKASVYETDLFTPLLECMSRLSGKKYGSDEAADAAMRVIAEHGRGIVFLIADGVIPGNEGRGYVLRRLLRRAGLFGRRLGLNRPFLSETAKVTIQQMGHVYPEIVQRQEFILHLIESEEEKFSETLSTGIQLLDMILDGIVKVLLTLVPREQQVLRLRWGLTDGRSRTLEEVGKEFNITRERVRQVEAKALRKLGYSRQSLKLKRILGEEAFKLYDTYGFPVELTRDIVATRGLPIDLESFRRMMEKQREKARAAHKFGGALKEVAALGSQLDIQKTPFAGYHSLEHNSVIISLLVNDKSADTVPEGQQASLILESSPFYGEMGGQVGDNGEIRSPSGRFVVTDTIRIPPDIIVHQGYVAEGSLAVGDGVEAIVDKERRFDIARNHTATHLLHFALRRVLGEQVEQRGSLVAPDRFRFDFSQLVAMMPEEIEKVNRIVNEKIRQNLRVYSEETPYKKAIKEGATALFGEKYGDVVRVLKIGEPPVSIELCGGTHVAFTGEIGFFRIISESSVGSGLRRIEAVTGREAEAFIDKHLSVLESMAQSLSASPENVQDKLSDVVSDRDKERKRALALERELSKRIVESLLGQVEVINGVKVLAARVSSSRLEALREMCDLLRERMESGVIVLGTVYEDKPLFIAAVTSDLVAKGYDAGKIVGQVAKVTGGGGGGKQTMAQAGGKNKSKLDEALRLVKDLI